jgi:hypothetical protein
MIKTQTNTYDSSTINASTYEYKSKTLYIVFCHATYQYMEVPEEVYQEFANAKSQGIALNELIKGKYDFEKLEE